MVNWRNTVSWSFNRGKRSVGMTGQPPSPKESELMEGFDWFAFIIGLLTWLATFFGDWLG